MYIESFMLHINTIDDKSAIFFGQYFTNTIMERTSMSSSSNDRPRLSVFTDSGREVLGSRVADKMLFNDHWSVTPWAKNSDQLACYNCSKKFSLFLRYHHCRACGNCICSGCSLFKPLSCFGYTRARICKYCCGVKYIEVQVDNRDEKPEYIYSHLSRSKEQTHQNKCVQSLVNDKVFTLGKFGIRTSDYSESHGGITNNTRAVNIKCFRLWLIKSTEKQLIYNEINTLRIFFHPNISRVIRTNIPANGIALPDYPYIMTEYAPYGTLLDFLMERYVNKSTNKTIQRSMSDWQLLVYILIQLVNTLKYIHDTHHMMHNDIHCGNILVMKDNLRQDIDDQMSYNISTYTNTTPTTTTNTLTTKTTPILIKLSDFTNARTSDMEQPRLKPIPTHRAPEIWRSEAYNIQSDIFSCGQTIAQIILIKNKTFLGNYNNTDVAISIGDSIINKILPPITKEKSSIGIELSDIVRQCWLDCEERPTLEELENMLITLQVRYFPIATGVHLAGETSSDMTSSHQSGESTPNKTSSQLAGETTPNKTSSQLAGELSPVEVNKTSNSQLAETTNTNNTGNNEVEDAIQDSLDITMTTTRTGSVCSSTDFIDAEDTTATTGTAADDCDVKED